MHFKKDKHYVYSFCAEFQYIMLTYFYKNITNIKKNYYRYYYKVYYYKKVLLLSDIFKGNSYIKMFNIIKI